MAGFSIVQHTNEAKERVPVRTGIKQHYVTTDGPCMYTLLIIMVGRRMKEGGKEERLNPSRWAMGEGGKVKDGKEASGRGRGRGLDEPPCPRRPLRTEV